MPDAPLLVAMFELRGDGEDVAIDEVAHRGEDLGLLGRQLEQAHTAAASRRVNGERPLCRSSSSSSARIVSSRRSVAFSPSAPDEQLDEDAQKSRVLSGDPGGIRTRRCRPTIWNR